MSVYNAEEIRFIKQVFKEAMREYEMEKETMDRRMLNLVEKTYHDIGYHEARRVANVLGVQIPHWMEKRNR